MKIVKEKILNEVKGVMPKKFDFPFIKKQNNGNYFDFISYTLPKSYTGLSVYNWFNDDEMNELVFYYPNMTEKSLGLDIEDESEVDEIIYKHWIEIGKDEYKHILDEGVMPLKWKRRLQVKEMEKDVYTFSLSEDRHLLYTYDIDLKQGLLFFYPRPWSIHGMIIAADVYNLEEAKKIVENHWDNVLTDSIKKGWLEYLKIDEGVMPVKKLKDKFYIGDRVKIIKANLSLFLGIKGTIIDIQQNEFTNTDYAIMKVDSNFIGRTNQEIIRFAVDKLAKIDENTNEGVMPIKKLKDKFYVGDRVRTNKTQVQPIFHNLKGTVVNTDDLGGGDELIYVKVDDEFVDNLLQSLTNIDSNNILTFNKYKLYKILKESTNEGVMPVKYKVPELEIKMVQSGVESWETSPRSIEWFYGGFCFYEWNRFDKNLVCYFKPKPIGKFDYKENDIFQIVKKHWEENHEELLRINNLK